MPRSTSPWPDWGSGSRSSPPAIGIVPVHELTDGILQFAEVPIDTAMADLLLQGAIEPLRHAVALRFGVERIGRVNAPELDLVGEVVRKVLGR